MVLQAPLLAPRRRKRRRVLPHQDTQQSLHKIALQQGATRMTKATRLMMELLQHPRRRKRTKKKKSETAGSGNAGASSKFSLPEQDNTVFRRLGNWPAREDSRQNPDVSIPVAEQYTDGDFPVGEEQEYRIGDNSKRTTSAEKRELERLHTYD